MELERNIKPKKDRKWLRFFIILLSVLLLAGIAFAFKTGTILNKVSLKGGVFKSILKSVPGLNDELKGQKEGQINILLLGMRGENIPGGGLLADTIMVASIRPADKKVSLVSIPRDFWVNNPGWGNQSKINAVYAAGEENGKKQGIEDMKSVLSDVTGMPIHYGVSINFAGFTSLVDALGGIDITLAEPFEEALQFNEPHVCDPNVFTVPTGKYEIKRRNGKVTAMYPLCTNPDVECGGDFKLPAGNNHLNGEIALCYARARYTSSDFDRARRQQVVIQAIKDKALSIGTLSDFTKINGIMDSLGDNVRTDMEPWEMKEMFALYQTVGDNVSISQKVLENSEEGLLYSPEVTKERGYILLPRGDNYDRIREMFRNIFGPAPSNS